MTQVWSLAALWLGLALVATLLSIWLGVATALSEIVVGTVAQLLIGAFVGKALLGTSEPWITFLSGTGAIVLTFLAGAEPDPGVLRAKWKETAGIGLVGFFAPFLGCAAFAFYELRWTGQASWLAGVALSTTSVAVVYAVMLELGLNSTDFGETVLAACFVNDLGTVIALGLIFAPFTWRTVVFVVVSVVVLSALPGRGLACHAFLPLSAPGGRLHDPADVHGAHVREHLRAVRPDAQDHRPVAVLFPDRGGHRQRRPAHARCERILFAQILAAQTLPRTGGGFGGGSGAGPMSGGRRKRRSA